MSFIWLILLFILIATLSDRLGGKKKKPPSMPKPLGANGHGARPAPIPFAIPELKGAPRDAAREREQEARRAETLAFREEQLAIKRKQYEMQKRKEENAQRQAAQAAERTSAGVQARGMLPVLTASNAQQAVVLAEILGKPKALRRRRF